MKWNRSLKIALFISGLPFAALMAQDADDDSDEGVYELSPFTVTTSGDDRYHATNATSGTQLNVRIKDLPMSLEVITSEFMRDTGANDFKESLAFSSGIYTDAYVDNSGAFSGGGGDKSPSASANVGDRTNNAIIIRGFAVPFQMRMGFRVGTFIGVRGGPSGQQGASGRGGLTLGSLIDTVNVDRSEVVRGPGALLYGLGVISGIVNVMPKRPMDEFSTELSLTVGSYEYYRGSVDTTGPLVRGEDGVVLSYRLTGALQDNEDWIDSFHERRDYQSLQLQWKPAKSLTILGEVSRGALKMEGHQGGSRGQARYLRDTRPDGRYGIGNDNKVQWESPTVGEGEYSRLNFVNEYGENYRWGADDFAGPYPQVWNENWWRNEWFAQRNEEGYWEGQSLPAWNADAPLSGPFNEPGFSLYGDSQYERTEENALLDVEWVVNRNLSVKAGAFFTRQEVEERLVHANIINNSRRNLNLKDLVNDGDVPEDHVFIVWNPTELNASDVPIYRGVSYFWTNLPSRGESRQFRLSANYSFETPFIGGDAEHNILVGRQDIRDKADMWVLDNQNVAFIQNDIYRAKGVTPQGVPFGEDFADAPVRIRDFRDWTTPFRYEGQPYVIPTGNADYSSTLWYTGHYAVYSGKFFRDRLTVIGGWRNDRYQARETQWAHNLRDPNRSGGTTYYNFIEDKENPGDPDVEKAVKIDTFSFGLNYAINDALSLYAVTAGGVLPNTGQRDGNGLAIKPEETQSLEVGLKFDLLNSKLSGSLSVFRIRRENAVWGAGNAPNPAYWEGGRAEFQAGGSASDPVGDMVDRGVPRSYGFNYHLYFKELVEGPDGNKWKEKLGINPIAHPITGDQRMLPNRNSPQLGDDGQYDDSTTPNPGKIMQISWADGGNLSKELGELARTQIPYVFITYDALNPASSKYDPELRAVVEEAIADYRAGDHPQGVSPLGFDATGQSELAGVNGSARANASVTYEEEATGVDLQMIYSPTPNLQFTFNFSHVKREAISAFNFVRPVDWRYPDAGDNNDGNIGTEFDVWVMDYGEADWGDGNFWDGVYTDPKDASTMISGIKGKSLYYGSENSASVWGRYSFRDGPLDGFGIGLGAIYQGPAQTHVPLGSSGLDANRYPTPETEANLQLRAALYYEKSFRTFDLRLQLNVNNLTNNRRLYSEAVYDNPDTGIPEKRRTEIYLVPVTWRLSCSIIF